MHSQKWTEALGNTVVPSCIPSVSVSHIHRDRCISPQSALYSEYTLHKAVHLIDILNNYFMLKEGIMRKCRSYAQISLCVLSSSLLRSICFEDAVYKSEFIWK